MAEFRTLSEYFDDVIKDNLGRDFDHIFDTAPKSRTVKKESYTDPRGTVASRLTYLDEEGNPIKVVNYINNKVVNALPGSIVDSLEEVDLKEASGESVLETLPSPLCKGDNYPRYNLSFPKGEGMKIVFDTAGIDADRIQISYGGDYLNIHIAAAEVDASTPEVFLVKAIDSPHQEYKRSLYIDTTKFSIKDLKYTIDCGLVTIIIPNNDKEENLMVFTPAKTKQRTKQRLVETKTEEKSE